MTARILDGGAFSYRGLGGCAAACYVHIIKTGRLSPSHCVVVSEIPQNHGTSVTNAADSLATQLLASKMARRHLLGVSPHDICWVEHYPPQPGNGRTLDLVGLEWMERLPGTVRPGYRALQWRPIEQVFREDGYAELWACVILAAERTEERIGAQGRNTAGRG